MMVVDKDVEGLGEWTLGEVKTVVSHSQTLVSQLRQVSELVLYEQCTRPFSLACILTHAGNK